MTEKKREKKIAKFLRQIELKANGAEMHLLYAKQDKKVISDNRMRIKTILKSTDSKEKAQLRAEIADAKSRFEESYSVYLSNLKDIKKAFADLENENSSIAKITDDLEGLKRTAIKFAREFYGDNIPVFPEPPVGVF